MSKKIFIHLIIGISSFNREQPHETTPTISAVNNEQERKLVDEITAPGGVRAAPSRELLTTFVTR